MLNGGHDVLLSFRTFGDVVRGNGLTRFDDGENRFDQMGNPEVILNGFELAFDFFDRVGGHVFSDLRHLTTVRDDVFKRALMLADGLIRLPGLDGLPNTKTHGPEHHGGITPWPKQSANSADRVFDRGLVGCILLVFLRRQCPLIALNLQRRLIVTAQGVERQRWRHRDGRREGYEDLTKIVDQG